MSSTKIGSVVAAMRAARPPMKVRDQWYAPVLCVCDYDDKCGDDGDDEVYGDDGDDGGYGGDNDDDCDDAGK